MNPHTIGQIFLAIVILLALYGLYNISYKIKRLFIKRSRRNNGIIGDYKG
jgi:hypothetical protein